MYRAAVAITLLAALACGGGSSIEGTWWCNTERVNPECWHFENGVVKNTVKGMSDEQGTYTIDGNTITNQWGPKRTSWVIHRQTSTVLEWRNLKTGKRRVLDAYDAPIR